MPGSPTDDSKREALRKRASLNSRPDQVTDELFAGGGFFDARDNVQVKYEMLRRVRVDGRQISATAEAFGLSRPTFYEAQAAFERAGVVGLLPEKRGPRGAHKLSTEVMAKVAELLEIEPLLGAVELAARLQQDLGLVVHPRSIERALARQKKD